jgi:hypothetical protein
MVSYLSKYIKLSTQPWTGNGITNPTESLTIDGLSNTSVTLSQENSNLLLNGAPVSGGGGGVTSVNVTPPVVNLSGPTGEVTIILPPSASSLTGITASNGIVTNQYTGDVTIATQGGVTGLSTTSFDLNIIPGQEPTDAWVLNSFSNIQSPSESNTFVIDQLPYTSRAIRPPTDLGVYQIEIDNRQTGNIISVFTTTGRATGGGNFYCGATMTASIANVNDNENLVIWTANDEESGSPFVYFKVGSAVGWPVGSLIQYAFFRIL